MIARHGEIVEAYWTHYRLSQGNREQRLAADHYFWAFEAVLDAVERDDDGVVDLLDGLLHAPGADAGYFAAGPLDDLLSSHPHRAAAVAQKCRRDGAWAEAPGLICLDAAERDRLGELRAMLPPIDS